MWFDAPVSFIQDLKCHHDDLFSQIRGIELISFGEEDLLLSPTLNGAFVVDPLVPIASPGYLKFDPHGSNIGFDGGLNVTDVDRYLEIFQIPYYLFY